MTTSLKVEDLFLAADLRSHPGGDLIADDIEACTTHEEVEAVRATWLEFFDRIGA